MLVCFEVALSVSKERPGVAYPKLGNAKTATLPIVRLKASLSMTDKLPKAFHISSFVCYNPSVCLPERGIEMPR